MPRLMRMPEVAAGGTSAVLHEWSVTENTQFGADDVLATVETDKAVVDVEAGEPGTVIRLLVAPGTSVEVGEPIAVLAEPGETVDDVPAVLAALGLADAAGRAPDPEGAPDQPASPELPPALTAATVAAAGLSPDLSGTNGAERQFASPLARRLAKERGLELGQLVGTGPGGRVVRRDVLAAPQPPAAQSAAVVPERVEAARPAATAPASGDGTAYTDLPHTPMRRAIARRLTESKQTIPHFTVRASVRADALLRLRSELADAGTRVSVNDLLVKAVGRAHLAVPRMSVVWTPTATRTFASVDVAVAVATPTGLVTPVLRGVERTPISVLAATSADLIERARAGRLRQEELEGGTLTVTNLGMFGTEEFSAIINPPQSAILAVGAARAEPVVDDGRLSVAHVLRLTLSADHRVIDGALAAEWMSALVAILERPVQVLI